MIRIRPLLGRARRAARRRFAPRPLILVYHRIAEEQIDPWRLCVSPTNFDRQLTTLRALKLRIVPVSELALGLKTKNLPRRTIAITFDDGYCDNLEAARPLLEKHEIPATLFATAGYIGRNEEFWWDALERVFLQPRSLPDVLELTVDGQIYRRKLGRDAELTASGALRWPDWKPFSKAPTLRHQLHDELWQIFVELPPDGRDRALSELLDWAGLGARARPSHRPLSDLELRQLRGDGLIEVGAHSMNHPALPALPTALQANELTKSKSRLEGLLGEPVTGFSYPQGRTSKETEQEVRRAGYIFACGSGGTSVPRRPDIYQLPRLSVGDWDTPRFRSFVEAHIAS
jgi:peptidoglycan/xylan/chitin deacetylase (PgdA/CDA1 family)